MKLLPLLSVLLLAATASASYSDVTANNMLFASASAYCPQSSLERWNCRPCSKISMSNVKYVYSAKYDVVGYVGVSTLGMLGEETIEELRSYALARNETQPLTQATRMVVVSFRGSKSIENWIQNLKFSHAVPVIGGNCPDCKVHQGFQESFSIVRSEVTQLVRERITSGAVIMTTGHSLGGALSALAAWDLKVNQAELALSPVPQDRDFAAAPVYSMTFGQPRVGNTKFATTLRSGLVNHYRVVHREDIVAHLPPMLLDFHHLPTEVWFRGAGRVCNSANRCTVCDMSGEDPKCSNSLPTQLSIPDHLTYLDQSIAGLC